MSIENYGQGFVASPTEKGSEEREILETTEKELKLQESLEKWINGVNPELQERAEHFGLGKTFVEEARNDVKNSLREDLARITVPEFLKDLKGKSCKTTENLMEEKDKPGILSLIDRLSEREILDLLNRKLDGNITPEEKKMLDIFSYAEKKEELGTHDFRNGRIGVSLLNSGSLQEYTSTLMHEFTHKALSNLAPEAVRKKEISFYGLRGVKEIMGDDWVKQDNSPAVKTQSLFFKSLLAIDESFAHRVEKYYGREREPSYNAYRDKTNPQLFKEVYSMIDAVAAGKSLAEFDHFAAHIYSFFAEKWDKKLSQKDLEKISRSTVEEINKFKEK